MNRALTLALAVVVPALAGTLLLFAFPAGAQDAAGGGVQGQGMSWGLMAAALATGLSSLAAGFAVASVGSAAIGAMAEKPELLGRALIIVGLAEGIAIYGLIVSILILNRMG